LSTPPVCFYHNFIKVFIIVVNRCHQRTYVARRSTDRPKSLPAKDLRRRFVQAFIPQSPKISWVFQFLYRFLWSFSVCVKIGILSTKQYSTISHWARINVCTYVCLNISVVVNVHLFSLIIPNRSWHQPDRQDQHCVGHHRKSIPNRNTDLRSAKPFAFLLEYPLFYHRNQHRKREQV